MRQTTFRLITIALSICSLGANAGCSGGPAQTGASGGGGAVTSMCGDAPPPCPPGAYNQWLPETNLNVPVSARPCCFDGSLFQACVIDAGWLSNECPGCLNGLVCATDDNGTVTKCDAFNQ